MDHGNREAVEAHLRHRLEAVREEAAQRMEDHARRTIRAWLETHPRRTVRLIDAMGVVAVWVDDRDILDLRGRAAEAVADLDTLARWLAEMGDEFKVDVGDVVERGARAPEEAP